MTKVVLGMSGGVDSSISILKLKEKGYQPIGVSLKLPVWASSENYLCENMCCTDESLQIAKEICQKLGVEHHIYNVEEDFKEQVINYLINEYKNGKTPNPCIICNRFLKFTKLKEWAGKHNIDYISTGHYAKNIFNKNKKQQELKVAEDKTKDQTYGLSYLTQQQLRHIIFPLGNITKEEVFEIAKQNDFKQFLKKKESQDFCFVAKKAFPKFLEKKIGIKEGNIIDKDDKVLGEHKGIHFYTLGQKKGLNLPGKYYVIEKDMKNNIIKVTQNQEDLLKQDLILKDVNLINNNIEEKEIKAKIRYTHQASKATLKKHDNKYHLHFHQPQHAPTPGQFCVFYQNDVCLGGGIIEDTE